MSTMLAGRLNYRTRTFQMQEVPVPEPGPGQVRIKVGAAGICLSDIHLIDGSMEVKPRVEAVTLGHEVAGSIDRLGEGVPAQWQVGQRVLLQAGQGCGLCLVCQRRMTPCPRLLTRGVDYDGGWAEYALADHFTVVAVPDDLPLEQAAIIPDAVSTPWAAIVDTAEVRPVEAVGVWGVGGLGAHAVQLLRLIGAVPVIAIDPLAPARERAVSLGADLAIDPGAADFVQQVRAATGGRGLDVAFDMAGVERVRDQAASVLASGGRLVLVGLAPGALTISRSTRFSYLQQQVRGHYGSLPSHVEQLVELARRRRLDLTASVSEVLPLAEAPRGVERLAKKEGHPIRLVLKP
jgi:D-arabinose 1-dehydrogenase-like Zn-dependent alcohol dehydrogenase